jgi:hypothetical protein
VPVALATQSRHDCLEPTGQPQPSSFPTPAKVNRR